MLHTLRCSASACVCVQLSGPRLVAVGSLQYAHAALATGNEQRAAMAVAVALVTATVAAVAAAALAVVVVVVNASILQL